MAEKDLTLRLRRAVKGNNLFLVKRLIDKTDMRNIDPSPRRYTSLAWAAALGHEETFEYLLTQGHDNEELSKDSDNNTILMLLADHKPPSPASYTAHTSSSAVVSGAILRMARLYYDQYPWILDWSNSQGKTALHIAALKGNEELVRMFCDLGADYDLADNKGNTPLHYASSWGHIAVVQLLIERGCQYAARNNEGFTASDYAYSVSTRETLQDAARLAFENNKKARRNVFAQAAERGNEWGRSLPDPLLPPNVPPKDRAVAPRMRSESSTSHSATTASDNGDVDGNGLVLGLPSRLLHSTSSSPSHQSAGSNPHTHSQQSSGHHTPQTAAASTQGVPLGPPINPASALSPIANRMRERDADAMEKYLRRNRSGSQGTSSTDNRSQNGSSTGPVVNVDDITPLNPVQHSGVSAPRRLLRPSVSAAQLRTTAAQNTLSIHSQHESRHRSGTSPTSRPSHSLLFARTPSVSTSPHSLVGADQSVLEEVETFVGPPSQYAQFPDPPLSSEDSNTTFVGRRKAFHLLSKPLPSIEQDTSASHRRGVSAASVRG